MNDSQISFEIHGGCQNNIGGNYGSIERGKCVLANQPRICDDDEFNCGGTVLCPFLKVATTCQAKQDGFCKSLDTLPSDLHLRDESETKLFKTCNYDTDICKNISDYKSIINFSNDQVGGVVVGDMEKCTLNFCSTLATETCVVDPKTGNPFTSCSRYSSVGDEGDICNNWVSSKTDNEKYTIIKEMCEDNPSLGECVGVLPPVVEVVVEEVEVVNSNKYKIIILVVITLILFLFIFFRFIR
jgi:hypothetical protein